MKNKIILYLVSFAIFLILYQALSGYFPDNNQVDRNHDFINTQGNQFVLDQKEFKFVGANIDVESFVGLSSKNEKKLAKELVSTGTASGINVFRIIADKEVENKLVPTSEIIRQCESHGCYVLIAFNDFPQNLSIDEYKESMRDYVSNYKASQAVFGWEVFNIYNESVEVDLAIELANFVRSLDSYHIVTIGGSGLNVKEGKETFAQYKLMNSVSDFCVVKYDSDKLTNEDLEIWKTKSSNFFETISDCNGKPILLEEFSFASDLNNRQSLFGSMFSIAKENNMNPIFSSWGPGRDLVYTEDLEILTEIRNFY